VGLGLIYFTVFYSSFSGHSEVQWANVWQKTHSCWLGCSKEII